MRALLQRVDHASVRVEDETVGKIGSGLVVFLGIEPADETADRDWIIRKLTGLKLFEDQDGRMNQNLLDHNGQILLISQFTLHASTKKGTRPSFHRAAPPAQAQELYEDFLSTLESTLPGKVQSGIFAAHMDVSLQNNGPITMMLDSKSPE